MCRRDPGGNRVPRLLGQFKLNRPLGLLLHDDRTAGYLTAPDDVVHAEPDQIASAQLAVDGKIE